MSDPVVSNADLVELLVVAGTEESDHRRLALERASRAARFWSQEAIELAEAGTSLTTLTSVGPWVAAQIHGWLDDPPTVPEPDETRAGYLTVAEVRRTLADHPEWESTSHADLQTHSTDSDGSLELTDSAEAARLAGRTFVAATDHSQSLKIAHGQDAEQLLDQGRRIDAINATYADAGVSFRVLKSIEMDVFEDGSGDMDATALAGLDLVLGAFHSKLRVTTDATDRYIAALANPTVHVLAHPKARMYGRRAGLMADWPKVFDEAARLGKAVELDATPNRQDLNVEMATIAKRAGVQWFSMGTDAHSPGELKNLPFAMATAVQAGIPRERFLNYRTADQVREWAKALGGTMKAHDVEISRPTKLLWPDPEITKQVYADYLAAVADLMVPWLRDRPVTLVRAPDGVEAQRYFQKDTPKYAPDWIHTVLIPAPSAGRDVRYTVCDDAATLRWLGNQAALEFHPAPVRADRPDRPDLLVVDIDPPGDDAFDAAVEVAGLVLEVLVDAGLDPLVKTTGGKGLHVIVPIERRVSQDGLRTAAAHLTSIVVERHPELVTDEFRKAKRGGRVMLDPSRNGLGATIVALYSPRARPEATVSFPVAPDQLTAISPKDFTIATVSGLLDGPGPRAWAEAMASRPQRLPAAWIT